MIRDQIEAIVGQLGTTFQFFYGTAAELNVAVDDATGPVALLYKFPVVNSSYTHSKAVNNKFPVQIKFLSKTEFDQTTDDNEVIVSNMFVSANQFMIFLANYREVNIGGRFFKVRVKDKGTITPVYNETNANLCGVKLMMTVETMYNDNVTIPQWPRTA